jgi:aspartate carbamoyltransferase catalytic subunit
MRWEGKDFIGLEGVSPDEMWSILEVAKSFKKKIVDKTVKKVPKFENRNFVTLFYQASTRTRFSFEIAAKSLGLNVMNFSPGAASVSKGESLYDTVKTLEAMGVDMFAIRHGMSGAARFVSEHTSAHVLNAGDGVHEHPTQALLDIFTIWENKGKIQGLKVVFVGDHDHNRSSRSNTWALPRLGADLVLCGPKTLVADEYTNLGGRYVDDVDEALKDADVIYTFRVQQERQEPGLLPSLGEYSKFYGINEKRLRLAKPDVIVLHPAPMIRGSEITSAIADGEHSMVFGQVTNGVAVRMALIYLLLGGE